MWNICAFLSNYLMMLKTGVFIFLSIAVSCGVILRDPPIYPCEHYDLFDPVSRIISDGQPSTADDFALLAYQAVDQLNARSNSLYRSMLGRVANYNQLDDGKVFLSFYYMESVCRNNGKPKQTHVNCPFRENGRVDKCDATMTSSVNHRAKLERISCTPTSRDEMFEMPTSLLVSANYRDYVASAHLPEFRSPSLENFKCFTLRFKKSYSNEQEKMERFGDFQRNMKMAYFLQITEQGTGLYGPTKFSDLSESEFKAYATGLSQAPRKKGLLKKADIPQISAADLPDAFDWRNKSVVTPVKDQGQCGSCWAFSVTGNVEGQWAIQKGKLIPLSEQELVDCDKLDQGCGGGLPSNAYKEIIRLGGLEGEKDYPYDGTDDKCTFRTEKVNVYINDSVEISTNETEIAQWLVKNGPISIGINANAMMLYMGGVSHPWKVVCSPKNLDHGVLIVGYGKQGKSPFWIVKNSWGPGWGVKGYYLVYRGDGTCGVNEMCTSAIVK